MKRSGYRITILVVLLIGTNLWWAYRAFDLGITVTYRDAALGDHREALTQTLSLLPIVARPNVTRVQVLESARGNRPSEEDFEEDGFVWIGKLGLRFGADERLVEVTPSWDSR